MMAALKRHMPKEDAAVLDRECREVEAKCIEDTRLLNEAGVFNGPMNLLKAQLGFTRLFSSGCWGDPTSLNQENAEAGGGQGGVDVDAAAAISVSEDEPDSAAGAAAVATTGAAATNAPSTPEIAAAAAAATASATTDASAAAAAATASVCAPRAAGSDVLVLVGSGAQRTAAHQIEVNIGATLLDTIGTQQRLVQPTSGSDTETGAVEGPAAAAAGAAPVRATPT
jgi:hypothetical protein